MAKLSLSNMSDLDNLIINGDFDIWQRGTIRQKGTATEFYYPDRFNYSNTSGLDWNTVLERSTDVPTFAESGHFSNYSFSMDNVYFFSGYAAGYVNVQTNVEGLLFRNLWGGLATLSFWMKSTQTGVHCVTFQNGDKDRSYVCEYTVNSANTWEKKVFTVNFSGESASDWDFDNTLGLRIIWPLNAGSNFETTPGSWTAGNYFSTSNCVSLTSSTSDVFKLTQVRLEKGAIANTFVSKLPEQELALCQRYFEKTMDIDVASDSASGVYPGAIAGEVTGAYEDIYVNSRFAVMKRDVPTITFLNPISANAYSYNITNGADASNYPVASHIGDTGFRLDFKTGIADAAHDILAVHWKAEAELS